jgi:hypothetical protein
LKLSGDGWNGIESFDQLVGAVLANEDVLTVSRELALFIGDPACSAARGRWPTQLTLYASGEDPWMAVSYLCGFAAALFELFARAAGARIVTADLG